MGGGGSGVTYKRRKRDVNEIAPQRLLVVFCENRIPPRQKFGVTRDENVNRSRPPLRPLHIPQPTSAQKKRIVYRPLDMVLPHPRKVSELK